MLRRLILATSAIIAAALALPAAAQAACDVDRPIVFAGLDYDSARFHNALAQMILEAGYGCETDALPGQAIPLINGLARGDVDVIMEIWTANPAQPWIDAEAEGDVVALGTNFPDATEGWFVPRYLVEGADAQAPGLNAATDLAEYKDLFADPEEPGKGRFYNCVAGWVCEEINTKKLAVYGLADDFTNFRPGASEALNAAIDSAVRREQPIVFYYWGPTWLLGKYDLVMLEEPPYDAATWKALQESDDPAEATAYPVSEVIIGANAEFAEAAPNIVAFLRAYETSNALVSEALAYMQENDATPEDAARNFLATRQDVWSKWVPADIAEKVKAAL